MSVLVALSCHSLDVGAVPRSGPLKKTQLQILRRTQLEAFAAAFNAAVESESDVDRLFLQQAGARNRREVRNEVAKLGVIPRLAVNGDVLTVSADGVKVDVEWINYETNQVKIAGVPWTYDRSAPPSWQVRQFERAFARRYSDHHAVLSLLSEVHAGGLDAASKAMREAMLAKPVAEPVKSGAGRLFGKIATWGSLSVIMTGMANGAIYSMLCFGTAKTFSVDPALVWGTTCNAYNDRLDKQKAADFKGQVGYTDELAKSLSLVRAGGRFDCEEFDPARPEITQSASGWIAEVEVRAPGSSGSAPEAKNWKFFRASLVRGVLKEADILTDERSSGTLLAHVTFNENPDNPVTVKLPQIDRDTRKSDPLEVPANYKTDLMLLENATAARRMIYLAKTAQVWVKACLTGQTEQKYLRVQGNSTSEVGAGR